MQAEPRGASVLLVEPDPVRLASCARALRALGATVALARSAAMACERARVGALDAIVATADALAPDADGMALTDHLSIVLAEMPPLLVLADSGEGALEAVARRIGALPVASAPDASFAPLELDLAQVHVAEIVSTLAAEERSFLVRVVAGGRRGELRIREGSVHAAAYAGLAAQKSMHRLLSLTSGTARVDARDAEVLRAIDEPVDALLEGARRERDECEALRTELAALVGDGLVAAASGAGASVRPGLAVRVLDRLRGPLAVDTLLDEMVESDRDVLAALLDLAKQGRLRRVDAAHAAEVAATSFDLEAVRARAARAVRAGFAEPARVVLAAIPSRVATLEHTLARLGDVEVPEAPAASIPCPRPAARVRFGEGVELELVVLPLVPAYAPLWPLALAGAAAVVRFDEAAVSILEEACALARAPSYAVARLAPQLDDSDPDSVAALVRTALEAAQGE